MSIGIDKLVDSFMGNPAPLKAKVDRDNAGQPPNAIPKDLEEAIALQEIADVHTGAQNDQAMQAGGPQPSVVQKLQQMLASAEQRQQAQMTPPMPNGMPAQGMPPQMPRGMPPQMPRGIPPQMPQGMPRGMPPQMPRGMPPKPVMAAHGGSINHLMSNLGRHYDGGGIVAFAPGGEIKLGTDFAAFLEKMGTDYVEYANSSPEAKANLKEIYRDFKASAPAAEEVATVASKAAPAAAEGRGLMYGAGKLAGKAVKGAGIPGALASAVGEFGDYKLKSDDDIDTSASGTFEDLKKGELGRAAKGLGMGLGELGADLGSSVANTLDYVVPGKAPVSSAYDKLLRDSGLFKDKVSAPTKEEATAGDAETEKLKRLAAARAQTGQNTNPALRPNPPVAVVKPSGPPGPPKPSVEAVTKPEVEKVEKADPNGLRALLEANIKKELGKDEDAEWQKGAKRHEDYLGLNSLLQPKNARIAEREGMQRKIQGERLPEWVAGFDRASKPMVSGGIGTMLNNLGSGMQGQREAYSGEDLKFFDEISAMKDEVLKLQIEGKYKAAAAGEAAIKDAIANKRQAEQSGTSLLNTDELTAQRKQSAKEAAEAKVLAAKLAADAKLEQARLRAAGSNSGDKQRLAELKTLQSSKTTQLKTAFGPEKRRLQNELAIIEAEIAQMAGVGTMATAPGASSPGGTKPGWGKASTV
jgi:hypothetical protein